jgi:hypothetical protein
MEYSYEDLNNSSSIRKVEMTKDIDYSFALIYLEQSGSLHFRFISNDNQIDNNSGQNFIKNIDELSEDYYSTESEIFNDYNKVNYTNELNIVELENVQEIEKNYETSDDLALVPIKEKSLARKGLRFSYKLNKRIKVLLIKLFRSLPSFITGNYRRRINL